MILLSKGGGPLTGGGGMFLLSKGGGPSTWEGVVLCLCLCLTVW